MPEDNVERKKAKGYVRHSNMRHGLGSTTRMSKHKSNHSITRPGSSTELLNEGNHEQVLMPPRMLRANSKFNVRKKEKKPIIQLERSDSDENIEEFSDLDSGDEGQKQQQQDATQNSDRPALAKRSPVAPKFTNETVVSVSDLSAAASVGRSKQLSGTFLDESDLMSSAVSGSNNVDDLSTIVGNNSMRTQGIISRQKQRRDRPDPLPSVPRDREAREGRLNERIFKQYFNIKHLQNPVLKSFERLAENRRHSSHNVVDARQSRASTARPDAYSPLAHINNKEHHNLTATSLAQFDGDNVADTAFLLSRIWTEGWIDPDKTPAATPRETPISSRAHSPVQSNNIGAKARWAAQKMNSVALQKDTAIQLG